MPTDKPDGSPLSDYQRSAFSKIDAWSDDGEGEDFAASRASRGLPSREEERQNASYDETGPNSRQAREDEFSRMGRRASTRHAGVEPDDEGDEGDPGASDKIVNIAETIGLDTDLAAQIDPAAVGIVSDFATLATDLALDDGAMAAISEWLELEISGDAEPVDIDAAGLARTLGLQPGALGKMTPNDLQMAARFVGTASNAGMSIDTIVELFAWASKTAKNVPEARGGSGRGAGRGEGGGSGWHTSGEGVPREITKADIPKMSTAQLRAMMRSNFDLYQRSGAQAELTKRINSGRV
jgi:hypothetical protein